MRPSFRSHSPYIAVIAVAVAVMALTGFQCAQVGDRVTGTTTPSDVTAPGGVAACVQACNEAAAMARDAEMELFRMNIAACKLLPQPQRSQCMYEEGMRHDAAMEQIAYDNMICKSYCHEQGSGTGGQ